MKEVIKVKYGNILQDVELPNQFSSRSLEECLQNVFQCKGRDIFGLRFQNCNEIWPLDEITSNSELLGIASYRAEYFVIVFHSNN